MKLIVFIIMFFLFMYHIRIYLLQVVFIFIQVFTLGTMFFDSYYIIGAVPAAAPSVPEVTWLGFKPMDPSFLDL